MNDQTVRGKTYAVAFFIARRCRFNALFDQGLAEVEVVEAILLHFRRRLLLHQLTVVRRRTVAEAVTLETVVDLPRFATRLHAFLQRTLNK